MRMDEHIKRLIEKYTMEASRTSGQEALERYEMAYAQSKELGNAFTIRACATNLGAMYVSLGGREEARKGLKYLEEAVPPDGVSDCVSNGDLYFNMGLGCEVVGLLERAYRSMERAWEEYRGERDNLAMEISALKKLIQLSQTRQKYEDGVRWCGQLEETYSQAKRPVDQLATIQQRVSLQRHLGSDGLSQAVEECCQHMNEIRQQGKVTVGILVQMSVMLANFKQPQAAREYLEEANSLLGVEHSDSLEKAVVLQNLGTLCNFLDEWDLSLPYHRQAATIYHRFSTLPPDPASLIQPLAALRCQCHCVANHAYALAKMEEIDDAHVLFNRALELATQCGDQDTRWQMEEALGAIHFRLACHDSGLPSPRNANLKAQLPASRLKHLEKSLEWYKTALMHLAGAPQGTASVRDRVLEKCTMVKNFKDNASLAKTGQTAQQYSHPPQQTIVAIEGSDGTSSGDEPEKGAEKEEESTNLELKEEDDDDEEESVEEEESEEEESEESSSGDEDIEEGLPLGKARHSPAEEDDDQEQVKALYQAQLGEGGDGGTLQGSYRMQTVKADVHKQHVSSSAESASSEEEESDEEEEEEEEEDRRAVPPVPTQSPPASLLPSGTYETPQSPVAEQINELYGAPHSRPRPSLDGTTNYAKLDFDASREMRSGELVAEAGRRARPNFFVSSSDEESERTTKQKERAGASQDQDVDRDYETVEMRHASLAGRPAHRSGQTEAPVDFEMGGSYLSHGSAKERKDSKTCTIM